MFGAVRDFIPTPLVIFNVADVAVLCGVAAFLWSITHACAAPALAQGIGAYRRRSAPTGSGVTVPIGCIVASHGSRSAALAGRRMWVALHQVAAHFGERVLGGGVFDAFGHDVEAEVVSEVDG